MPRVPSKLAEAASCAALAILVCLHSAAAQDENAFNGPPVPVLLQLSLEELMNVTVTSVSKKTQPLSEAPAAVFVITQEDIRRAGVTTIPDALRMAPGIQVARIDSSKWSVSSRGFTGRFSNKLLVLIDGRSVYTPLFSGVVWESEDLMLEDVERIEVIRGPGAALWGANAVNGVINIITKHSRDTQGGLATAHIGTENYIGQTRYGGKMGEDAFYRLYAKYADHDSLVNRAGDDNHDEWDRMQGGFRIDADLSDRDSFMLQGGMMSGDADNNSLLPSFTPPYQQMLPHTIDSTALFLLSRWQRDFENDSDMALQMYYTWSDTDDILFQEKRHTFDLDFQHRFQLTGRQELIWGLGYRFTTDEIGDSFKAHFFDPDRDLHLFSAFIQDEITLIEDRLHFTVGSKFEHNDFTGFEIQPNARLAWTPNDRNTFWAAVSRAVHTPARAEQNVQHLIGVFPPATGENPLPIPAVVRGIAPPDPESEDLLAYELGHRIAITNELTLDTTVFLQQYDHIGSGKIGTAGSETIDGVLFFLIPLYTTYTAEATSFGIETSLDWHVLDWWRLNPAYTYYDIDFKNADAIAGYSLYAENERHQFSLRSQMDISEHWQFDAWLRYMGNHPWGGIPKYLVLDLRLGWRPNENVEFAIGAQNLFDDHHPEHAPSFFEGNIPGDTQHSAYIKMTLRF
ncbi:TonB-dependent receptor [bacterium]|nr:TonB-dependent receptor [bacterium]